jgi:hypothetical protein
MLASLKLYAIGGLLLTIALLAGYGAWQSNKAAAALDKVDALSTQLTALQRGVDASNEAIIGMGAALDKASRKAVTIRERVITMERNNVEVRAFLDIPVPPDGCMLDDSCTTGRTGPQRGASAPLRAASATGEP